MQIAKVIVTWVLPDNGVNLKGPIVFDTSATFDELLSDDGVHDDLQQALAKTALSDLDEVWDEGSGECEYDDSGKDGKCQAMFIAAPDYSVTIVYLPVATYLPSA